MWLGHNFPIMYFLVLLNQNKIFILENVVKFNNNK